MPWKVIVLTVGVLALAYVMNNYDCSWLNDPLNKLIYHLSFNLRQTASYDPYYAMFVLQWPPSVCIFEVIQKRRDRGYSATPQEDCRFPPQQLSWTIHGIWNSRSSGSFCSGTPLKRSDIENVTVELNQRWIQVRKYFENFNFWEYEWKKHGTCLLDHPNLNDPNKYFGQAVKWHQQYDPTAALMACNMPPDDKKKYNSIEMAQCLKQRLNITSRIMLDTRNDYIYRSGTTLLREIRICFNKDFGLVDCQNFDPSPVELIYPRTVENK